MEKTIKIGNKSVKLSNNIGWMLEYKHQFGHDILPTLMPVMNSVIKIICDALDQGAVKDGIDITKIDSNTYEDALLELSGLQFTDFIEVVWALAKAADDSIDEPAVWVKQFDSFPFDTLAVEVFGLVAKGCISSKNLKRLQSLTKNLKPLESTESFSQESSEG